MCARVYSICIIMCAKTRAARVCVCVMYRHKGSTTSDDSEESGRACYIEKSVCVRVRAININCWDRISLGKNLDGISRAPDV